MATKIRDCDVEVSDHGSIILFRPLTDTARNWIEENVDPNAQWFCRALAVESRYAFDIVDGMQGDGLTVMS